MNIIIKEHIKSGVPIGSSVLVDKYKLDLSPATVRNEMSDLEEDGYIRQPHTSAGRVPTEKAYRLYIENLSEKKIASEENSVLSKILHSKNEHSFKLAAKALAMFSQAAVFWAIHRRNLYYTGISNLISQPEFRENNLIYDISLIVDRMEEIIDDNFDRLGYGAQILLGADNPFSKHCSSVLAKYKLGGNIGLVGVLGPMRMNYERNFSLIKFVAEKLK